MANYREDFANINLETGTISRNFMNHSIGGGDALGDRFGVRVFRNGEAVTLGGTCAGYFVRNTTGETVVITGGVVSGNEAYVTLPAACYAVEGSFTLAIKVTVDSEIVTLRIVDGVVDRTNTSVVVDPGDILPSIEDLLQAIEDAVESIPADYSSLWTSLAPAFSSSTAYKAGQYVTYDGKFWRFTTDHAAGAWNAAHATQVNVGGDMSELKSALDNIVVTSNAELNRIIKRMYIPSSVSIDLSTVNRVTVFNGYSSLYGFRFYNSSNTKLLDFTKSSNIGGITKVGSCYADIGDLSDIEATSKNYYCSVNDSVLIMTELADEYDAVITDVKHRIAPEFSTSETYNAGQYFWYNGELRRFSVNHSAGALVSGESALVNIGLSYDVFSIGYMFASPYNPASTYSRGDFCTLNNRVLYMAKVDISTAEAFTASHWQRIFLTDLVKENKKIIQYIVVSDNTELNKVLKRLYIPSSLGIDVSTITRVSILNGYLNLYGVRFYNGTTLVTGVTTTNIPFSGIQYNSDGVYVELADLSVIGDTSVSYTCSIFPSVYDENGIINDYLESMNTKNNSPFGTFTASAQASQGNNAGEEITVMSFNVAHYNKDRPADIIPDSKIFNTVNEIGRANADFICVQEDSKYIDSNNVREANGYIYNPSYPNTTDLSQTTVRSKISANSSGAVTYSNGRWIGYGVYTIGSKTVLVLSTHPVANYNSTGTTSEESIAARLTQYTELFQWIAGTIDLTEINLETGNTGSPVHVPTHTHCIIGMDANSLTDDDMENLADLAEDNDFVMGNGGRLGWLKTARDRWYWYSLDNIIVSDNIIINSFEAMTEKYSDLYSDHVPVVAKLTLLD